MKILIVHGGEAVPRTYPDVLALALWQLDCEVLLQEVSSVHRSWASRVRLGALARKLVAGHEPDLVHVIHPDPAVAQAFASRGASVIHSTIDRPSPSDWVVAPSQEAMGRIRAAAPGLDYRISCLPFAVDLGESATGAGSYVLARVDPGDPVAREWIEEAAARVPDVPVRDDGNLRDARFFLSVSSRPEAWPVGVAEAMAAGRPVVASWGGAASEFVGEAVSGFLCAPGDTAGLASNMEYLWNHPGEALFLGIQAREEAKQLFGVEAHARSLLKLYLRAGASRLAV